MSDASARGTWVVRLISWMVVAIPAAWGVAEVVRKSAALFK